MGDSVFLWAIMGFYGRLWVFDGNKMTDNATVMMKGEHKQFCGTFYAVV